MATTVKAAGILLVSSLLNRTLMGWTPNCQGSKASQPKSAKCWRMTLQQAVLIYEALRPLRCRWVFCWTKLIHPKTFVKTPPLLSETSAQPWCLPSIKQPWLPADDPWGMPFVDLLRTSNPAQKILTTQMVGWTYSMLGRIRRCQAILCFQSSELWRSEFLISFGRSEKIWNCKISMSPNQLDGSSFRSAVLGQDWCCLRNLRPQCDQDTMDECECIEDVACECWLCSHCGWFVGVNHCWPSEPASSRVGCSGNPSYR